MSDAKVIQFSQARKEKQEHIKREYERVLFNRILGCYTVIEKLGLSHVEMLDISKKGCSFRAPQTQGAFNVGEEVDFRFYFSNNTYVPTRLSVRRVTELVENGQKWWLYGCDFDASLSSHNAIARFVEFVETFSQAAKEDKGEKQVWFL